MTRSSAARHQFVDAESRRRVVRGNHRAGADADDRINRDLVAQQLLENADVRRASQSTGAEHERDACGPDSVWHDHRLLACMLARAPHLSDKTANGRIRLAAV